MIQLLNSVRAGLGLYVPEPISKRLEGLASERGQAFVEYAILLVFIAIAAAVLTAFTGLGSSITTALSNVGSKLTS